MGRRISDDDRLRSWWQNLPCHCCQAKGKWRFVTFDLVRVALQCANCGQLLTENPFPEEKYHLANPPPPDPTLDPLWQRVENTIHTSAARIKYWYRKLEGQDFTWQGFFEYMLARHGKTADEFDRMTQQEVVKILQAEYERINPPFLTTPATANPPPAVPGSNGAGATAPESETANKSIMRPATVNQRMLDTLERDPESLNWPAQKWADALECSKSTVHGTPAWKRIQAARALQKADRANENDD